MKFVNRLSNGWKYIKEVVGEWFDDDPLIIIPFISYANQNEAVISGRVIEDEGGVIDIENNGVQNIINTIRSLESDEAKNIDVIITFQGKDYFTKTDHEGYFRLVISHNIPITNDGAIEWDLAHVFLPNYLNENGNPIHNKVKIMLPNSHSTVGIITDIDDTVLQTHVDSFLKMRLFYETFFKNSHTRIAFEGMANALKRLVNDQNGAHVNPIFYLSNSPWNLYAMLFLFFEKNNMPQGPLLLRDFGFREREGRHQFKQHKKIMIETLLNFYKNLSFILVGDATERDIDIYLNAYKEYPDRIKRVFIRATKSNKRNQKVMNIIRENPDVNIHLFYHSKEITELFLED